MGHITLLLLASLSSILLPLRCSTEPQYSVLDNHPSPEDQQRSKQMRLVAPDVTNIEPTEMRHNMPTLPKKLVNQGFVQVVERTYTTERTFTVSTTTTTTTSKSPTSLGYSFVPSLGWYRVYADYVSFEEAKAMCERDGAKMIVLNSKSEAELMVSMMNMWLAGRGWVGVTDAVTEGSWLNIFGEPISKTYVKWAPNEPLNQDTLDCVYMNPAVPGMMVTSCDTATSATVCEI